MKKLFPLFILVGFAINVFAADLLVEEFGLSPAYSSIADAVAASVNGDRIIIKNRTGGIPWVENITINKSLEFLSYDNDDFFIVQGNWTITPASGRVVTIIGMQNTSGGLSSTNGTGTRTVVNIFDSEFTVGNLNLSFNGLDVNIVGTKLNNGYIGIKYGSVVGCQVTYSGNASAIRVETDAIADNSIVNIVGNRVNFSNTSTSFYGGIHWNSSSQFFNIRNNFVYSGNMGIYIDNAKSSTAELLTIYNNTVNLKAGSFSSASARYGIYIEAIGTSSIVEVMNNLVDMSATNNSPTYRGIYAVTNSGQRNVYYNMVDNNNALDDKIAGTWTVNTNNNITTVVTTNTTTGASSQGTNLGNPANPFYDIDLTRNDMGCYGGSYTQDNFFPLFSGAARIWFVTHPFNIRQGNTLSIQGESFDR